MSLDLHWLRLLLGSPEDTLQKQIDLLEAQLDEDTAQINQLTLTIEQLKSSLPIKEPEAKGFISLSDAYALLKQQTGSNDIYLSDSQLNLANIDAAKKFTNDTKVWADNWVKDDHDCDNFSFALMGYWSEGLKSFAFGIAWSNNHAFNVFVDENKQLWIVEPQTNQYMSVQEAQRRSTPDGLQYFPIRLILM
jgi:hypothetical protein